MFTKMFAKVAAPIVCLALFSTSLAAQPPSSKADDSAQFNAYAHSYVSMVIADGLANVMAGDGETGEVALWISDYCHNGFKHCQVALNQDDDTQWAAAVDDLELARMWCNTLIVFAGDSYSYTTLREIRSLMWNLDIAIENAEDAIPRLTRPGTIPLPWDRP
ncbi:hypothetical protein [Roseimaritima ulvae]|uniref:Uncharacterized protein n=1 Tax=Roseimaritima ulvae TaxID=980254 RepID=A0A5B9QXT7_9BACT|nr:hypothetical protein [Roseimaritima ulvae]QEG42822.1 hypothetical protein UC8_48640 [Roseimaritima ulvae]